MKITISSYIVINCLRSVIKGKFKKHSRGKKTIMYRGTKKRMRAEVSSEKLQSKRQQNIFKGLKKNTIT